MSEVATDEIRIRAESSTADPDVCKFITEHVVHPGGPFVYESAEQAAGSPLPQRLFALDGVRHVLITGTVVTVTKDHDRPWEVLRKAVGAEMRAQLRSSVPAVLESAYDPSTRGRPAEEVRRVLDRLMETEVNTSIASHGGKISIVDYRDRKLYISMSGGCQGCASSKVTLRQGVEVMVHRVAPEVSEIIDTTDHSAGHNPFYRRAAAASTAVAVGVKPTT